MGEFGAGQGFDILFHASGSGREKAVNEEASGRPIEILLVEDNPGDVRLMEEALKEVALSSNLRVVGDGEEVLEVLRGEGKYAPSLRPDWILLDLNLPRKDGLEVLKEIKADRELEDIPVVVFTGSEAERDIVQSYGLRATRYIVKPLDLDGLVARVRSIKDLVERIEKPRRE